MATHATEDFEAFGAGVVDPTLDFGEFGIATASDGFIASADRFGAHAFSGQKYLASDGTITITFTRSISAFGFFGSDLNEVNRVALRLTDTLGNITDLAIPGRFPATSGSNMFFGFGDRQVRYTAISLQNAPSGQDGFGFDDLIIGNSMVPEPADWIMLIAGFGVTGAALRFRRRVTNIYPKSRRRVPV